MIRKLLFALLIASTVQGCVATVAGAAVGVTSGAVIYDKRPVKVMLKDDNIAYNILRKLETTPEIARQCHVAVTCYNGVVLIVGQAPTNNLKTTVTSLAKTIPHIRRLYNEMSIEGPSSSITKASDSWITAKVKTQLIETKNLKSGQIKVLTENGVVYLMGIVNRDQAALAVSATRTVDGVQKVVKIFEYDRNIKANNTNNTIQTDEALYKKNQ